ncbi:MAG: AAA family ATPase, partial [Solirubrobacteraceae bacterium]
MRQERAILQRLAGVDGVPKLTEAEAAGLAGCLVMGDIGGVPMTSVALPLDTPVLLDLAVGLAEIIGAVHQRGVLHRDINPANVLLCGPERRPALIDFDLATSFNEEHPEFSQLHQVMGTLPYLAPEQTGRTGRPVDQRADLYALGATMYEMATGRPPFGDGEALRLLRDHLGKPPVAPLYLASSVPALLSDVIMKLLEKEPGKRYQSAEGVAHDLRRIRDEGPEATFALGERDFPARLQAPANLVGRQAEIRILRAAFEECVHAGVRAVLLTGPAGVGKSAVAEHLRPSVMRAGGWFVSGNCDSCCREAEADPIRQVLRGLCRLLLTEPEVDVAPLRTRIVESLGSNLAVTVSALPELAALLGVEPDVAATAAGWADTRLRQS